MDAGSGSLELPKDGSPPEGPDPDAGPIDLGLPPEFIPPPVTAAVHHVVVGPHDADLVGDPDAGSGPTLIHDPVDLEPQHAVADLGSSPTLVRDPVDLESPVAQTRRWRRWVPYLAIALLLAALVFTCGALP
jgi:hypothetical protein